jgi:hypothetical protein
MSNVRFTAWLSFDERERVRALAREHACSENFIVRMALRSMLYGTTVPQYLQQEGNHDAKAAGVRR